MLNERIALALGRMNPATVRLGAQMTQVEFGALIGCSSTKISRFESDFQPDSSEVLIGRANGEILPEWADLMLPARQSLVAWLTLCASDLQPIPGRRRGGQETEDEHQVRAALQRLATLRALCVIPGLATCSPDRMAVALRQQIQDDTWAPLRPAVR